MMLPMFILHYFRRSATVDLTDNQGSACEGMHIASSAGTWAAALTTGLASQRVHAGRLDFAPWLPPNWDCTRYRLTWRGFRLRIHLDQEKLTFVLDEPQRATLPVTVQGRDAVLPGGPTTAIDLRTVPA